MKVVNVISYYVVENTFCMSDDLHFRMSFIDRLKFLIHGEYCIFRISNELKMKHNLYFRKKKENDMKAQNLTVEVEAKLTVSKETAEACLGLLELYLKNNPNMEIRVERQSDGEKFYLAEKEWKP